MDTLKILLGATVALLLAALGLSWKNLKDTKEDPAEVAKQQVELKRLELEKEKIELEKLRLTTPQAGTAATAQTSPAPNFTATPSAAEMEAAQAQLQALEEERKKAERESDAALKNQESAMIEGRAPKTTTPDQAAQRVSRRLAMIQQATLMGRVAEWVESPDSGAFATIEVTSPENVQPGTELLIRRNGGILGKLRVDQMSNEGTIANPVTKFAGVKPVAGDELILEPPFIGDIEGENSSPGH